MIESMFVPSGYVAMVASGGPNSDRNVVCLREHPNPAYRGLRLIPGNQQRYPCAIKDVYAGRIVGYSLDSRMKSRLAVNALNSAVSRRGEVTGCVLHSDRGSQLRSRKTQIAIARHGLIGSMDRVGACGDNAAMESFFSLLQNNVLDRQPWATRNELRAAIVHWIERTYHRRRRQDRLGRLTPVEFETIVTHEAAQSA